MSHILALKLYPVPDETARDFKSTSHSVAEIGYTAVKRAGADPIGFIDKYPGRVVALHLKDMTPDRKITEVSDGTLDVTGCANAAQAGSTSFLIVENDSQTFRHLKASAAPLKTCVENWNGGNASCHVLPRFERSI